MWSKMLDVISHVVLDDKRFYKNGRIVRKIDNDLGGPASYVTIPLAHYNFERRILTSFGEDLPKNYLDYFHAQPNTKLDVIQAEHTTRFLHEISEGRRTMKVLKQAAPLDDYWKETKAKKACLISPVFHEISAQTVSVIKNTELYDFIAVDIQGLIRSVNEKKEVIYHPSDDLDIVVNNAHCVKFSYREAKYYTHKENIVEILSALPQDNWQIITMGDGGVYYSYNGKYYHLSPPKIKEIDATGAGDVFFAALVADFIVNKSIHHAIANGAAMAAESVKYLGVSPIPSKDYENITKTLMKSMKEI
ncbi:MAG: PfkB family carbohydrate kinase [Candidatus Heimdallarchaeaceae archaeon]